VAEVLIALRKMAEQRAHDEEESFDE
jgi:hypothetical protein